MDTKGPKTPVPEAARVLARGFHRRNQSGVTFAAVPIPIFAEMDRPGIVGAFPKTATSPKSDHRRFPCIEGERSRSAAYLCLG